MKADCYIFDFDGTLAHSAPAYRKSFGHSVRLHTGLEIDQCDFRDFWNMSPREVLSRYGEELLEEMLVSFEEYYYANHHRYLIPFAGIEELLAALNERGARVGVVSLKPRRAGELELDFIGLRSLVQTAVWGDDVQQPKPNPDGVLRAMSELCAQPERTLVIGDSPSDILMGRAAGTLTAAAMWGITDRERLLVHSPDLVLESPVDLVNECVSHPFAEV
jgi:pyrophosphatase PpaX